jgi:hypothetical protein
VGLRDRLRRLENEAAPMLYRLACPECGEEFVIHGDAPLEYIVHEWRMGTGEEGCHEIPQDALRAFEHEHHAGAFVEKRSGLPFLSRPVSGMNLGGDYGA